MRCDAGQHPGAGTRWFEVDREDVVAAKHAAMTSVGASCDGVLRRLHLECLLCSCLIALYCCMISGTFSRTTRLLKP